MADLTKYKFSADLKKGSAGDFKMFLKSRYGYNGTVTGLTAKQIDQLVEMHYGEPIELDTDGDDEVTDTEEQDDQAE